MGGTTGETVPQVKVEPPQGAITTVWCTALDDRPSESSTVTLT